MARQLKLHSLTFAVVLALSGGAAASAHAEAELTAEEYPALLQGKPGQKKPHTDYVLNGRVVTCKDLHATGTISAGSDIFTLKKLYTDCTMEIAGIKRLATITANGCDQLHRIKDKGKNLDFICELGGGKTEIHVYTSEAAHASQVTLCEYEIGEQTEVGTVAVENVAESSPPDVAVVTEASEISFERTKGTVTNCGAASGSNGTYSSEATLSAVNTLEEPIGLMVH